MSSQPNATTPGEPNKDSADEAKPVAEQTPPAEGAAAKTEPLIQPIESPTEDALSKTGDDESGAEEGDRNVIEVAIERALDGVRVEVEELAVTEAARIVQETPPPAESTEPVTEPVVPEANVAGTPAGAEPIAPVEPTVAPAQPAAAPAPPTAETPAEDASGSLTQMLARMAPPASLEELGKAMNASGGRSMDEVAEGIMRPVIREWLVNNLATMAERIVREEIDRISRRRG